MNESPASLHYIRVTYCADGTTSSAHFTSLPEAWSPRVPDGSVATLSEHPAYPRRAALLREWRRGAGPGGARWELTTGARGDL